MIHVHTFPCHIIYSHVQTTNTNRLKQQFSAVTESKILIFQGFLKT